MSILIKYGLTLCDSKGYPSLIGMHRRYDILTTFLTEFTDVNEFQDNFIPYIEKRSLEGLETINEGGDIIGYDSNSCSLFIDKNETSLENSQFGFENLEMPTLDFKNLCLEWLSYLKHHRCNQYPN